MARCAYAEVAIPAMSKAAASLANRRLDTNESTFCIGPPPAALIARHRSGSQPLQVEVGVLPDVDCHTQDSSASELPGSVVFLAHLVSTIESDTQAVTAQREVAALSPHRS